MGSIQTFGAALPFHPHVHALSTDGLLARGGAFVPVEPDPREVEESFRGLVIRALRKAERLSGEFAARLLGWERSGFSVYAEQVVLPDERERLARYVARAPLPFARVREGSDGRMLVRAGASEVVFPPLELIHALAEQIPDKGQHLVRYYGAYSSRARRLHAAEKEGGGPGGPPPAAKGDEDGLREGAPEVLGAAPAEDPRGGPALVPAVRRGDADRLGDHLLRGRRPHPRPLERRARAPPEA